jgi:hypothetical protein
VKSIVWAVGRALSQTFNHKDSLHLTFSARAHMESRTDPGWAKVAQRIDRVLGEDHCLDCWRGEVERARMVLRLDEGQDPWDVR